MFSNLDSNIGAFISRVTLGLMFLAHGLIKIFVFTIPGTVGFFSSVGFPGWTAYPVIAVEVLAGIALIIGYRPRLAALLTIPTLLGALFVHAGNGFLFSSANGGWEYPAFLVLAAIAVVFQNNSKYAVKAD